MPSEENKSKEQKTAESKSTVFGKTLARFSLLKLHAWQWCSRTRKNLTIRSFLPMKAFCPSRLRPGGSARAELRLSGGAPP